MADPRIADRAIERLVPPHRATLGLSLRLDLARICVGAKLSCGLEIARGDSHPSDDCSKAPCDPLPISVGMTVERAMALLVARYPRYSWTAAHGVLQVVPKEGEAYLESGRHPLDRVIPSLTLYGDSASAAVESACDAGGLKLAGGSMVGKNPYEGKVALELERVTIREALNRIAVSNSAGPLLWVFKQVDEDWGQGFSCVGYSL